MGVPQNGQFVVDFILGNIWVLTQHFPARTHRLLKVANSVCVARLRQSNARHVVVLFVALKGRLDIQNNSFGILGQTGNASVGSEEVGGSFGFEIILQGWLTRGVV